MSGTWPRAVAGVSAAMALLLVTACGSSPVPPVSSPTPPAASVRPVSSGVWRTDPVTVTHNPAVPPVPVLTGVRYAGHPDDGYDRIVFDIEGGLPGYTASYVSAVRANPSDRVLKVPGRRYLSIVFTPLRAHREGGEATITGTHEAGLPMLTSYVVAGDFEGHVSIALGLESRTGYRIGELPGRIYIDIAT